MTVCAPKGDEVQNAGVQQKEEGVECIFSYCWQK